MKNKYRILKIVVTVIVLSFLLSFSLKRYRTAPVKNISVKMNEKSPVYFVDGKDIRNLVKKQNGSSRIGEINIPALEKTLNSLPAIDSANVYIYLNGDLHLDIKQRVPVFRVNFNGRDFYVDEKGTEFPVSKNYSHPCMLVTGDIAKEEYPNLKNLVTSLESDDFCKKFFIGISKKMASYNLLTAEGNYAVEIGDLDNVDIKLKGFKAFAEKYLIYQDPDKYSKISVRYDNQIVTTLNPNYKENDSIIAIGNKEIENAPSVLKKKALEQAQQNLMKNTTKAEVKTGKAAQWPASAKKLEKKAEAKEKSKASEKKKPAEKKASAKLTKDKLAKHTNKPEKIKSK